MSESNAEITEDEAATLARWAGLNVPRGRLPLLATNLIAARAAVANLAGIAIDPAAPVNAPFDPSWPAENEA